MDATQESTQHITCDSFMLDAVTVPGPIRVTAASDSADGVERWVVTRYADVVAALSDPRLSSERAYAELRLDAPGTGDQAHDAGDLAVEEVAQLLRHAAEFPGAELDAHGRVLGLGLSLLPTPHRVQLPQPATARRIP